MMWTAQHKCGVFAGIGTMLTGRKKTAMLAEDEYPFDVVPVMELLLAFEVAKNALAQAKERAQQAVTAMMSAARPAQDELLWLEALLRRDLYFSRNVARFMRLRGEAAAREGASLIYSAYGTCRCATVQCACIHMTARVHTDTTYEESYMSCSNVCV
jgi:hypothetical protein